MHTHMLAHFIDIGSYQCTLPANCRVEISTHMKHQNYGLIFGINTAVALILQTVLTVILTDKRGLAAGARTQVGL